MYLHLGGDVIVRTKNIIGIFDLENSTVSKQTRAFLAAAEKAGRVVNVSCEIPKSFVVVSPRVSHRDERRCALQEEARKKRRARRSKSGPTVISDLSEPASLPHEELPMLYITQISSATLRKRTGFMEDISIENNFG